MGLDQYRNTSTDDLLRHLQHLTIALAERTSSLSNMELDTAQGRVTLMHNNLLHETSLRYQAGERR